MTDTRPWIRVATIAEEVDEDMWDTNLLRDLEESDEVVDVRVLQTNELT